jgi:hypothetical protein
VFDHESQTRLQALLQRESRSVLSYVADAYPWTAASGEGALEVLKKLIDAESAAVTQLGEYLVRRRMPAPVLSSYPASFTTINFLSLGYLLPRLVEAQRRSIKELEHDLPRITDSEAHAQVEKLLAVKRRTLAGLEELAAGRLQPTGA